jgi:hypothetical protein
MRSPQKLGAAVRCYFIREGHITAVEMLPGVNDEEAIRIAHALFDEQKRAQQYDGIEVWGRT